MQSAIFIQNMQRVYAINPYQHFDNIGFRSWSILLSRTLSGVEGHPGSSPDLGPSSDPFHPGSKAGLCNNPLRKWCKTAFYPPPYKKKGNLCRSPLMVIVSCLVNA